MNYDTANIIIEDLECKELVEKYFIGNRGLSYRITKKGAQTYKMAKEAYENVGMNLFCRFKT